MSASTADRFLERIRAEYLEMPGLRLTREQVGRLCGVESTLCQSVLNALVEVRFLCVSDGGVYARVTEGEYSPPRAVKADLRLAPSVAKAS
jgi:hypothetical protein